MEQSATLTANSSSESQVDCSIDADRREATSTIPRSSWSYYSPRHQLAGNLSALESSGLKFLPEEALPITGIHSPARMPITQPTSALRYDSAMSVEVESDSIKERISRTNPLHPHSSVDIDVGGVRGPHQKRFTILGARIGDFRAPTPTPSARSDCADTNTSGSISMEQVAAMCREGLVRASVLKLESLLSAAETGDISNQGLQRLTGVRVMGKLSRKAAIKVIKLALQEACNRAD